MITSVNEDNSEKTNVHLVRETNGEDVCVEEQFELGAELPKSISHDDSVFCDEIPVISIYSDSPLTSPEPFERSTPEINAEQVQLERSKDTSISSKMPL